MAWEVYGVDTELARHLMAIYIFRFIEWVRPFVCHLEVVRNMQTCIIEGFS